MHTQNETPVAVGAASGGKSLTRAGGTKDILHRKSNDGKRRSVGNALSEFVVKIGIRLFAKHVAKANNFSLHPLTRDKARCDAMYVRQLCINAGYASPEDWPIDGLFEELAA